MLTHNISLLGKRESNEDQHFIFVNLNNIDTEKRDINLFAVFDGHGGKDVSKYLKENLPNYFTSKIQKFNILDTVKFKKYIVKVFNHIQINLEKKFKNFSYNVGSTALVAIFFKKDKDINYYTINVGDCRAVLCNKNNIAIPLTKDHKPHLIEETERIKNLGGDIYFDGHDWRVGDLSVSRAFGDMDASPYVTHVPEIFKYKISKGDKFIILGCDGLWDVTDNQEAINLVLENIYEIKELSVMNGHSKNNISYNLANYAINKGSTDNVSITIIFFND